MLLYQDNKTKYWIKGKDKKIMRNVHDAKLCEGRGCAIHNHPSDHALKNAPMLWREDRGILERICQHGVGHPDYDSAIYLASIGQEVENVHGCDGCCYTPKPDVIALTFVKEAIAELKLQKRLIKKAWTHDPTLYRSWVQAVIPSLIKILKDTEEALAVCTHPEDIAYWDNQVALAKSILGKS